MRPRTTPPVWPVRGPHRRACGFIAVAALAVSALGPPVLVHAQSAPPPSSPAYGIRPGFYGETTLPGDHYTFALEPGTSIDDTVVIFNFTRESQQFDLYGADLILAQGGGFAPAARGAESQGAGSWIVPSVDTVEVPAGSHLAVAFTVTIPDGAVPGDHPGTIVVERRDEAGGPGVRMQPRLALRVLITVPGEINLGVAVGVLGADHVDGTVRFTVPIQNTGNVTFTTAGTVTILGQGPAMELALRPDGLYAVPGGEATLWSVWEDPPWFGRVQAHADIDVTVGNHDPVRFTTEPITVWLITWLAISIALAIVGLTVGILLATRRQREERRRRRQRERAVLRRVRETLDQKAHTDLTDDEVIDLTDQVIDLTRHERVWTSGRRKRH